MIEIVLRQQIARELGHCWKYAMPIEAALGDSNGSPDASTLELFEDGRSLGPAHAVHDDIRTNGKGAFSHWNDQLYFSTSDNSDPRSSGRQYTFRVARAQFDPQQIDLGTRFRRLAVEQHNYPELSEADFARAVNLARSTIESTLDFLPESERVVAAAKVNRKLDFLSGAVFENVNGFPRRSMKFEEDKEDKLRQFSNGRSIHLELGSYTAWPDERADAFVTENNIGDIIRLDMNVDYRPDVAASVTALPFADDSIDIISSNSLFEHVAYPHDIIRESFRVLRPGGVMITTVPFHFVFHGCPNDYLRYTGQFFEEVCTRTGFSPVMSDTWGPSGVYCTTHQLLKATTAGKERTGPRTKAAQIAHLMTLSLLASLQSFDDDFDGGGPNHFQATQAFAIKPGVYKPPIQKPDRSKPFVDRFPDLICPATGLPLRREGDYLFSVDGQNKYPIEKGIPNLFVVEGFGSRRGSPPSSRQQFADWKAGRRKGWVRRILGKMD